MFGSVQQRVAMFGSVQQRVAMFGSVQQRVAMFGSVQQCKATRQKFRVNSLQDTTTHCNTL